MAQHSLSDSNIKITADAGYDSISYCDPEGRVYIRRISPRISSDVYEWSPGLGYTMKRKAEQEGYRFMGAYVGQRQLRAHQVAKTIWDEEGIDDFRREDWMREVEARATLPRSQWAKCSLNGAYESQNGKRTRMVNASGKSFWPNECLPQYVQDRRAGKAPDQMGWVPRTAKDAKAAKDSK